MKYVYIGGERSDIQWSEVTIVDTSWQKSRGLIGLCFPPKHRRDNMHNCGGNCAPDSGWYVNEFNVVMVEDDYMFRFIGEGALHDRLVTMHSRGEGTSITVLHNNIQYKCDVDDIEINY